MAARTRHPRFTRFLAAAHRGGCLHEPNVGRENTLHAFRQAVQLGYTVLETDVRTTADGHVVVFHDPTLDRVTDGHGPISKAPLSTVKRARVGGVDEIPTLDELLEEFGSQEFLLDLKDARAVRPTLATLRRHNALNRVSVGSFGEFRLRWFRLLAGRDATTSAGQFEVAAHRLAPRLAALTPTPAAFQIPMWFDDPPIRLRLLTQNLVDTAHARGAAVHVWTVNTEAEMQEVLDLGVDGIFTDATDVLRSVLIARGLWSGGA